MDLFQRRIRLHLTVTLALLAATPITGLAQHEEARPTSSTVGIGSRVRFTEPGRHGLLLRKRHVVGTVVAADDTSVTVLPKKGPAVRILRARAAGGSLKVSLGKRPKVAKVAILTGLGFGLMGAGAVASAGAWCLGACEPATSGEIVGAAAVSALTGAALGAAAEHFRPAEKWVSASLSQIRGAAAPPTQATPLNPEPALRDRVQWQVSPSAALKERGIGLSVRLAW